MLITDVDKSTSVENGDSISNYRPKYEKSFLSADLITSLKNRTFWVSINFALDQTDPQQWQ